MSSEPTEGPGEGREDADAEVVPLRRAEVVPPAPGRTEPGPGPAAPPVSDPAAVAYTRTEDTRRLDRLHFGDFHGVCLTTMDADTEVTATPGQWPPQMPEAYPVNAAAVLE